MVQIPNFQINNPEYQNVFEPIKLEWCAMKVTSSELKEGKANPRSAYVEMILEPMEELHPELKGRKVYDRLLLWHENPTTARIAGSKLSQACKALGIPEGQGGVDTELLHHKPMAVKLRIAPAKDGYEAKNEVSGYDAFAKRFPQAAGMVGMVAAAAPQVAQQQQVAGYQPQMQQPMAAPGMVPPGQPAAAPLAQPGVAAAPPWLRK